MLTGPREAEFANNLFPLNLSFEHEDWRDDWRDFWRNRGEDVTDLDQRVMRKIVKPIPNYPVPVISLDKSNNREAVCLVFEKVNVGGKKLDAFELVTAIYAASNFDLRSDWNGTAEEVGRRKRIIGHTAGYRDVLKEIASTDFLQACTLLHTRNMRQEKASEGFSGKDLPQVSCNRDALLGLPLHAYQRYNSSVEKGYIEAAKFLNEQKIIWHKDVPYPALTTGLATIFSIINADVLSVGKKRKLEQWFWCVTMGEQYGSSTETRLARDVHEIVDWLENDSVRPRAIDEAIFQHNRLVTLRSRVASAYKGVHALLMRSGCRDFVTGRTAEVMTFANDRIDIHHIFPRKWCEERGIAPKIFNSSINKTPLSKITNIIIGGNAPSKYLAKIQERHGISEMELDILLKTHLIDPHFLRQDDFDGFFAARWNALSALVAEAMGKSVAREQAQGGEFEPEFVSDTDEDMEEDA